MKNRIRLVSTSIVVVMFLLSLFITISTAQPQMDDQYEKAKVKFEDAREKFNSARLKFDSAKDKLSRDELKNKTIEYLEKTIDYLVALLEANKLRIESSENRGILPFNASDSINIRIAQLEELRTKILQANSPKESIKSARDLNDIAIKITLETRYYAGILNNRRNDLILGQADTVSARMEAEIQKLKEQDKDIKVDTEGEGFHLPLFYSTIVGNVGKGGPHLPFPYGFAPRLDEQASGFKNLLNEAKENHQKTLELFSSHEGFDSNGLVTNNAKARVFLDAASDLQKDTVKKLNAAGKQLRDFFKEIKKLNEVEKPQ